MTEPKKPTVSELRDAYLAAAEEAGIRVKLRETFPRPRKKSPTEREHIEVGDQVRHSTASARGKVLELAVDQGLARVDWGTSWTGPLWSDLNVLVREP